MPRVNKLQIRQGTGTPAAADFATAEPAFDPASGKLWVKGSAGMVEIGAGSGGLASYATPAAFPATGSPSVLYLDQTRSRLYRWVAADSVYAEVGTIGGIDDSMDGGVYS